MKIVTYGISILFPVLAVMYNASPAITTSPFEIKLRNPAALIYAPVAVIVWLLVRRVYWIGFKQGRKVGHKEFEEINKIGKEAGTK